MTPRILIIADDFTGAAEMAGIAARFGLSTHCLRMPPSASVVPHVADPPGRKCAEPQSMSASTLLPETLARHPTDALFIDTDSRSLPAPAAAAHLHQSLAALADLHFDLVFKKTDSLLRGPILAEVAAIAELFRRTQALLLPANPSRNRTIFHGEYFLKGTPLHLSELANDPEFPATSSHLDDLLGKPPAHIHIPDHQSAHDIAHQAARINPQTLPAGAADFFTAILKTLNLSASPTSFDFAPGFSLLISGSASSPSKHFIQSAQQRGLPVIVESTTPDLWRKEILNSLSNHPAAIVAFAPDRRPAQSQHLLTMLTQTICPLLNVLPFRELFIEGGATASAIFHHMNWRQAHSFREVNPGEPGPVRMQINIPDSDAPSNPAPFVTVKPGSYPWPPRILERLLGV